MSYLMKSLFFFSVLLCLVPSLCFATPLNKQVSVPHKAVVLMYHRISEIPGAMSVSPTQFKKEMSEIKVGGYHVISARQLVDALISHSSIPEKSIVITFDDGWASQRTAISILKDYGYPATFALITSVINRNGYLGTHDIEDAEEYGFDFVNHSRTHFTHDFLRYPSIDIPLAKAELSEVTRTHPFFVYPYGSHSPALIKALKDNGYVAAFGVEGIPVNMGKANIFNIPRFLINSDVDEIKFHNILKESD